MFSMQLSIENPRRASLLQHLIALAAVHGIRTLDGLEDLVRCQLLSLSLINYYHERTPLWNHLIVIK